MVTITNPKIHKGLIALFLMVLLFSFEAAAQNEVAIGSGTTKSNAILWLNGNGSQGLILPVVTNKSAVSNPDKGMVVYDDSDNKVWYRSNSAWVEVGSGTGGSTANLNLLLQGNQLQLRDGTTVQSTVNIAGGTQSNGAFLVFNGGSWQYATLSGDVTGANGALVVNGIKGKAVATLPATLQALVYDPSANSGAGGWVFQTLTSGGTVTNITGTSPVTVTNPTTTPTISIANGGITNTLLATDAINSSKIQDATITAADIAGSTITADKLAQSAATSGQVLKWNGTNWVPAADDAGTGTTATLSNGQILVGNGTTNSAVALSGDATLSGGVVTIGSNAITTAKILDATITGTDIANTTITATKLAQSGANNNQVLQWNGTNWVPVTLSSGGTVTQINTANGLTGGPITNSGTISIASSGVGSTELADNAVVTNKISDNAVTTSKINNSAVDNTKLADNAVASVKISDGSITGADIAATTITADKLAQSSATSGQVLKWNGTNWVPAADDAGTGTTATLSNGQILVGNGTTNSAVALSGDATLSGGVVTIGSNAITAAEITDASITGADLATNIAISTTGNISVNAPGIISGIGSGLTTLNASNISSGSLALGRITPGTNGQVLTTVAGVPAWQTSGAGATTLDGLTDATVTAASSGQLLVHDGAGQFRNVSAGGDATISNSGAVTLANSAATRTNLGLGSVATLSTVDLAGSNVSGILPVANGGTGRTTWDGLLLGSAGSISDISTGTAGQFLRVVGTSPSWQTFAVTSTDITDGTITDADINGSAAIAGTKVSPIFGTQNISTTGTLSAGATTVSGLTIGTSLWPANASGALTNDGTGSLSWAASTAWSLTGNALAGGEVLGSTNGNPLSFITNNVERVRITPSGNVGIGTSSPNAPLQFLNSIGRKIVLFEQANNDNQFIGFAVGGIGTLESQIPVNSNSFLWKAATSSTTSNELMRITGTGNVGIGTNNPRSKLEIQAGDLILSGSTAVPLDPPDINFVTLANVIKAKIWTSQTTNTLWISTDINPVDNKDFTISSAGNIGIDNPSPTAKLDIIGTIKIVDGTQAAGKVLTSDANGLASWTTPSGSVLINNPGTRNLFAGAPIGTTTTGTDNSFVGSGAGDSNTSGNWNVFIGSSAGTSHSAGDLNTIIGWNAGQVSTGHQGNTLIGAQAGQNTTGITNTFIGEKSGQANTSGIQSVFVGNSAGLANTNGNQNTILGYFANVGAAGLQNATAIGHRALVNQDNSLVLGSINGVNSATSSTNVGIGTTTPSARLDISGNTLLRGTNTNAAPTVSSGLELMVGRSNFGTLIAGQTGADIALNWGGASGGYRHFIQTRHNAVANSNSNSIDFYVNNSTTAAGSIAPNNRIPNGNVLAMSMTATGIGIGTALPNANTKLHILGAGTQYLRVEGTGTFATGGIELDGTGTAADWRIVPQLGILTFSLGDVNGTINRMYLMNSGTFNPDNAANPNPTLGQSTARWGTIFTTVAVNVSSDRRLKNNIHNLNYGLKEVLELRPVSYSLRSDKTRNTYLGLIAQEVQELIPEIVSTGDDAEKTLGMRYAELVPVLIKAIQEQQEIIETLKSQNAASNDKTEKLNKEIEAIKARLGMTAKVEK